MVWGGFHGGLGVTQGGTMLPILFKTVADEVEINLLVGGCDLYIAHKGLVFTVVGREMIFHDNYVRISGFE